MNESRLSRILAFFADTPKSAVSTTDTKQELQLIINITKYGSQSRDLLHGTGILSI